MSDHEKHTTTHSATTAAIAHAGPSAERYESALERYLAAVRNADERRSAEAAVAHGDLYWHIENNVVADVMTRNVISVGEDAPFKEVVDTLVRNRISAVPVVDTDERVVGLVSESDLLAKVVTGGDPRARVKGSRSVRAETRRKARAETAGELMSAPAVTTRSNVPIVQAARAAALAHVRRLPVVDEYGALVGIVTRSDLLRVFRRGDSEIRVHIVEDILARQFCLDPSAIEVTVHDSVVTLAGRVERRLLIAPLLDAVRATAGVVGVHDQLTYRIDDTILPPPRSMI